MTFWDWFILMVLRPIVEGALGLFTLMALIGILVFIDIRRKCKAKKKRERSS
ncbi:hypothetical protein L3V16_20985 [Brucella ciceri]|uniref:hypothetical protein n=1 Tax=Brucella ciceri TaxID=391287 RepID=UPI0013B00FFD|nr:hypothetical protein [Brucella ciceri]MCH6206302.1 hypothetical protein [Brucella ciceri]